MMTIFIAIRIFYIIRFIFHIFLAFSIIFNRRSAMWTETYRISHIFAAFSAKHNTFSPLYIFHFRI